MTEADRLLHDLDIVLLERFVARYGNPPNYQYPEGEAALLVERLLERGSHRLGAGDA